MRGNFRIIATIAAVSACGGDKSTAPSTLPAPTLTRVNGVTKPTGLVGMTVLIEGNAFAIPVTLPHSQLSIRIATGSQPLIVFQAVDGHDAGELEVAQHIVLAHKPCDSLWRRKILAQQLQYHRPIVGHAMRPRAATSLS